ncbi:MAG: hypothetical protein QM487_03685 [Candidatus Marithrix sp.]
MITTAISQTKIEVSWTDNSIIETDFIVKQNTVAIATLTTLENITNYADTGLTCSTTYSYSAYATNTYGDSTVVNGTTMPCTPTNFTATQFSTTQINLAWDDIVDETSYILERNGVQISSPTTGTTSYNDSGPVPKWEML